MSFVDIAPSLGSPTLGEQPRSASGQIVANLDRIARNNTRTGDVGQERQNFRVSVTNTKIQSTILTPRVAPCLQLLTRRRSGDVTSEVISPPVLSIQDIEQCLINGTAIVDRLCLGRTKEMNCRVWHARQFISCTAGSPPLSPSNPPRSRSRLGLSGARGCRDYPLSLETIAHRMRPLFWSPAMASLTDQSPGGGRQSTHFEAATKTATNGGIVRNTRHNMTVIILPPANIFHRHGCTASSWRMPRSAMRWPRSCRLDLMSVALHPSPLLPMIIIPKRHADNRGWFSEIFHDGRLRDLGIICAFVQENLSNSKSKRYPAWFSFPGTSSSSGKADQYFAWKNS